MNPYRAYVRLVFRSVHVVAIFCFVACVTLAVLWVAALFLNLVR